MSRVCRRDSKVSDYQRIELAHDIPLQAALDFFVRATFPGSALDVGACSLVAAHADHGNRPQGVICLPRTAAVQSVPSYFARGGLQRACTAKRGQRGFIAETVRIVAGRNEQRCPPSAIPPRSVRAIVVRRAESICPGHHRALGVLLSRQASVSPIGAGSLPTNPSRNHPGASQLCARGDACLRFHLEQRFSLHRRGSADQEAANLVDGLGPCLDGTAAGHAHSAHGLHHPTLSLWIRVGITSQHGSCSILRIGRITLATAPASGPIGAIHLDDMESVTP